MNNQLLQQLSDTHSNLKAMKDLIAVTEQRLIHLMESVIRANQPKPTTAPTAATTEAVAPVVEPTKVDVGDLKVSQ